MVMVISGFGVSRHTSRITTNSTPNVFLYCLQLEPFIFNLHHSPFFSHLQFFSCYFSMRATNRITRFRTYRASSQINVAPDQNGESGWYDCETVKLQGSVCSHPDCQLSLHGCMADWQWQICKLRNILNVFLSPVMSRC